MPNAENDACWNDECSLPSGHDGKHRPYMLPAENDAPCPTCGSGETWVSYEDQTANYCGACRSYFRPIPPGQTVEKGPRRRDYWPDSSRPNWCPCVEGDPHLCKPELHPTSPVHGSGTRPIPPAVGDPTTDHGVYRCECVTDDHEKPHTRVLPPGQTAENDATPILDALEDAAHDAERIRETLARLIPPAEEES